MIKSACALPNTFFFDADVRWLFRYANQYPKAIRLVSGGLIGAQTSALSPLHANVPIDVKPLVTHRFPIEEATKAFYTAADINSGSIKCQVLQD